MSAPFRSLIGFGVVILSAIPFLNAEFTYRTAKQADVLRTDSGMRLASLFPVEDTNLFSELRMVAINIFQEERGSRCRKRPETLLSRLKDLINPPIVSAAECQADLVEAITMRPTLYPAETIAEVGTLRSFSVESTQTIITVVLGMMETGYVPPATAAECAFARRSHGSVSRLEQTADAVWGWTRIHPHSKRCLRATRPNTGCRR